MRPSLLLIVCAGFAGLTGCAYARVSGDLGGGAIGPPPSSAPSVGCNNSTPDENGIYETPNVCGSEIQVQRPSSAPRSLTPTPVIGVTAGGGVRLVPNLYLEPDVTVRAYVSFAGAASPFREPSFPGVSYDADRPSNAVLIGLPVGLQWRPASKWSLSAGVGPAVVWFDQDFSATTSTGTVDHATWSWRTLDVLARASVEYDLWRTASFAGAFDLRGTLGLSAEADGARLSRGLLLNVSVYVEKTPAHGR